MVIVIMGVIGGMVAVFMKSPIDAYFDSARRAGLTDTADTVTRRMARDIQKALPNSIKTSSDGASGNRCVEFIPTKTGARYRAEGTGALSFVQPPNTSFNMLRGNATSTGVTPAQQIEDQDIVVVYNLGIPGADAYEQSNTATVNGAPTPAGTAGAPETVIALTSSRPASSPTFPFESPNNRFQVVPAREKVVAYVCSGNNIYRIASQNLAPICPSGAVTSTSPNVVNQPILARNATCTFDYGGSDLQRNALLRIRITITEQGESVRLYHEVHVNNTP